MEMALQNSFSFSNILAVQEKTLILRIHRIQCKIFVVTKTWTSHKLLREILV